MGGLPKTGNFFGYRYCADRKNFSRKNPAGLTTGIESKVCYYFRSLFVE